MEQILDVNPVQQKVIKDRMKQEIEENDRKRKNLADAIALGSGGKAVTTLFEKLEQLETEAIELKKQSEQERQTTREIVNVELHEDALRFFIQDFEERIRAATPDVKKSMLKKCIERIEVDHEAQGIRFYTRKIPAVTPELEDLFKKRKPLNMAFTKVVSATSSGGTH